jgi:hypothetical protein
VIWSPGWAWGILTAAVAVFVVVFDVHAAISGGETMTGRMRDWLADPVIGPFAMAGWAGLFVGLMYHLFLRKGRP